MVVDAVNAGGSSCLGLCLVFMYWLLCWCMVMVAFSWSCWLFWIVFYSVCLFWLVLVVLCWFVLVGNDCAEFVVVFG